MSEKSKEFIIDGKPYVRIPWGEETMEIEEARREWKEYYPSSPCLVEFQMNQVKEEIKQVKSQPCPDCGTENGKFHNWPCDQEECPYCHKQAMACSCNKKLS